MLSSIFSMTSIAIAGPRILRVPPPRELLNSADFVFVATVGLWLMIGILTYMYANDWQVYDAFFYCIDAGMSIGFGEIKERDDDSMHAFTILYVWLGSSIVSGAFGYVLTSKLMPPKNNLTPDDLHSWDSVQINKGWRACYWHRIKYMIGTPV